MLQGYAGSYESGFPDEYAFEDWLYRLECLSDDEQALSEGEHVSGPAADTYRSRISGAHREFAGRVLTKQRQARDLMGNPLLQIHHGEGMTCVLNPATAACQLRGTVDDPLVTPDTDDCFPSARTSPALIETSSTSSARRPSSPKSSPILWPRPSATNANEGNSTDSHRSSKPTPQERRRSDQDPAHR